MGNADATATLRINTIMDSGDAISNINSIQKALKQLKMPKNMTKDTEAQLEEILTLTKQYQNLLDKPSKSNTDLRQLDQLEKQLDNAYSKASKLMKGMDFSQIDTSKIRTEGIDKLISKLEKAQQELRKIEKQKLNTKDIQAGLKGLEGTIGAKSGKTSKSRQKYNEFMTAIDTGDLAEAYRLLQDIQKANNSLAARKSNPIEWAQEAQKHLSKLEPLFKEIVNSEDKVDDKATGLKNTISQLGTEISQLQAAEVDKIASGMENVASGLDRAADEANSFNSAMNAAAHSQTEMQQQVLNLQNQVKNYFGLDEIFRKIGDLARNAMDTVKELDAAMTETAVVTNFDVSDMWKMLPEYTKNANALGSTIADVYNAATLYYQQGLTTSQSMALANETLKMARIGGIEAAEATDMMTAALRGFNMEINEVSAQRINDVYSKLAAITAADTKEIGTAMERTASIASSAGMDFETTSAFLAQMIETTREAPENLGTAMKTIVARFQEMKVDPNTLVDSEGETLDFNRVDKALKSVGISLVDQNNQFRDADDVFLEIASRWDGMTQAQQRYIATIAAGSRQQSRFIAMMQDYDRTLELVDAAYTAEGAGQAQFEKTLESMDSKLNRLKNAWDQFAMGFMNADFLKIGVDLGTKFLDIFEKLITGFSKFASFGIDPFGSIIKSALTATAVFGGLLGMSRLLMAGIGKFSGMVLGQDLAKSQTGFVGTAARFASGEGGNKKENRKSVLKQQSKEEQDQRRKDRIAAGKEQARIQNEYFNEGVKKSRESGKGIFDSLKAGSQSQKEIRNVQKQISKNFAKGDFGLGSFKASFAKASKGIQETITSDLIDAARTGVKNAHLDKETERAVLADIDRIDASDISNKTKLSQIENLNAGQRRVGDLIDVKSTAAKIAPLSKQFEKVGTGASRAGQAIQMFGANLQGTPLAPFGSALMIVGQGIENIGMLMGSGISSIKKWGASMVAAGASTKLAGASAGTATKFFAGLGSTIWKTLSTLWPYIAVAAAAAAVIGVVAYAATKSSREFKRQSDAAAQASQDLDTTKQALEALNNDLTELNDNDNALDGLIKGTTEWNSKLAEANAHVIEMMQHYQALNEMDSNGEYKYVKTDEDGRMSITEEGQKALKEEYENAVSIATANNAIQGAILNGMKDRRSKEYKDNQAAIQSAMTTGVETDRSKQARLQNANVDQMNEAREAQAWKTGVHAAINDLELPNQDTVENILSSQKDQYLKTNQLDAITLGQREDLENEYADLMGYVRTGKGEYKDAQGNELTIDFKSVKEQLPELRTISDMQTRANDVSDAINHMDQTFSESEQGTGIEDKNLLSEIMAQSDEASADEINKLLKTQEDGTSKLDNFIEGQKLKEAKEFKESDARELENLLGKEEGSITGLADFNAALEEYADKIRENGEAIVEQQQENQTAVVGLFSAAGISGKTIKAKTDPTQKGAFSYEEMGRIVQIADGMADNMGADVAYSFAEKMATAGKSAREQIEGELSGIDFSNSLEVINSFNNLSEAAGAGAEETKAFAEGFKNSFDYAQQSALALQQVITSDDLAEALKDIKLDDIGGKYNATAIAQAAESSHSLSTYLESTNMSAGSFANIMNKMADAELDISDLTPGLVAFADAMDQVSNATGNALKSIQDFNAGDDLGSVDDFAKSSNDAIAEMAKNGEWGNDQMANYFDHFFEGSFDKTALKKGSYKKAYNEYKKQLDKILIGGEGDDAGTFDVEKGAKAIKKDKNDKDIKTTEQAIADLQEEFNLTKQAAEEYFTAIVNKSEDLKLKFEQGDAEGAYSEYKDTTKQLGEKYLGEDKSIASLDELFNIRKLVGDDKKSEFWKQVTKDFGEEGKKAISDAYEAAEEYAKNPTSANKKTYEDRIGAVKNNTTGLITTNASSSNKDIQDQVIAAFVPDKGGYKNTKGEKTPFSETDKGALDLEKAIESFTLAAGGDQNRAYDALQDYIKTNKKELGNQDFEFQGQTVTGLEILEQGLSDLVPTLTEGSQWVTVGQTIGEAIVSYLQEKNKTEQQKQEQEKQKQEQARQDRQFAQKHAGEAKTLQEQKKYTEEKVLGKKKTKEVDTAYSKDGFNNTTNKLKTDNFKSLLDSAIKNKELEGHRTDVVGQYLQNNTKQLLDNGASNKEISASMKEAAQSMKDSGWNDPQKIASALNKGYGTNLSKEDVNIDKDGTVEVKIDEKKLQEQLKTLHGTLDLDVGNINIGGVRGAATGQNNPNSAFHRVGTMARGSGGGYTIPGRPTLTGEEGEELVWEPKRNQAYMVGSNGPQFANISKDAVVWNAEQTKRIKKNSGSVGAVGTGARGITPIGTMAKGRDIGRLTGTLDATAEIKDVIPPKEPPKIPVTADIKVEGEKEGGIKAALKKFFGGGNEKANAHTIPVNAEVTKTSVNSDAKTIKVTGQITKIDNKKKLKGVEATAKVTKVTKSGKVEGEPVKVDAKASVTATTDTSSAEESISGLASEASGSQTMTVGANTAPAYNAVNRLVANIRGRSATINVNINAPSSINVPIYPIYRGGWSKTITFKKAALGMNYQKYNSYAQGTVKAKKGLTLTGEEGYEVAYLPKEGKSMILGMDGPQMVNIPKDAVIWPHEQSKKIIKNNKGMPVDSRASGTKKKYTYGVYKSQSNEAKFFSWIGKVDRATANIERWSDSIDKAKKLMDEYSKSVRESNKVQSQIRQQSKLLTKSLKQAQSELKYAKKALNAENKSKKKTTISYQTNSSKKSKSKEFRVSEGTLVKKKNGVLVIDESKIRKIAKDQGKNAFQVNEIISEMRSQAKSIVDEYNGYVKGAKDAIQEIKDKQKELRDSIHEMFWSWENELTKVKRLQDKVSLTDSFESVISSMQSTLEAGLKAGYLNREKAEVQYQNLVRKHIQDVITKFKIQSQLSRALSNRLKEDVSYTDEYAAYQKAIKERKAAKGKSNYDEKVVKEQEMKERYEATKLGSQYYRLERDETGALVIKQLKEINHSLTSEQYKAITDYYNQLLQDIQDLNSATSDIQSTISGLYGEITSLTSEMDGYAKTVINGMQQDEEDTIDALSNLNSSLQEAFNDLIDSVRKELDRQRKLEQNEKTEKDISNQMNRLAMLRADTSGSNAAEIAQLEKEIAEATGNYEDSLEDQLLDRLQESADEAAKQRERQIEILQTQLEYTKAVGQYIAKAEILLDKLIKGTISQEDLAELKNYYFVGSSGKDGLTKWGKELLEGEWDSALIKISNFDSNIDKLTQAIQDLTKKLIISEANEGMVENLASRIKEENNGNSEITRDQLTSLHKNNLSYQGAADLLLNLGYSKQDALKKMIEAGYTDLDYLTGITYDGLRILGGDLIKAGIKQSEVVKYYPGNEARATEDKATIAPSEPPKAEPTKVETPKTSTTSKTDAKKEKEASKKAGSGTVVKDIIGDPKVAYSQFLKARGSKTNSGDPNWGKIGQKGYEAQVKRGKKIGKSEYQVAKDLAGTDKLTWKQVLTAAKAAGRKGKTVKGWNPNAKSDSNFRKAFVAVYGKWAKFAQGGLANYTGPAWMDGTPSKPELVLNATDTKNFVALKDVLAEATRRGVFNHDENTNNVGDAVFDININVDKIDSDYDVDKVAKRVEKIIIDKAKHRNVTVVGRAR